MARPVSKKEDNVRQLNVALDLNMNDDSDVSDDWLRRHRAALHKQKKKTNAEEQQKSNSK